MLTAYVLAISARGGLAAARRRARAAWRTGCAASSTAAIARASRAARRPTSSIRKLAAIEALARVGKAEPALLGSVTIEPNLWPTSARARLVEHPAARARRSRDRDARLREAEQIVRARLDLQGTTMGFSTERRDDLWWLMVVRRRERRSGSCCSLVEAEPLARRRCRGSCAARSGASSAAPGTPRSPTRGACSRCEKFAAAFETTPVTGTTTATLAGATRARRLGATPQAATLDLPVAGAAARDARRSTHAGTGAPVGDRSQSRAAIPLARRCRSGYRITQDASRRSSARAPGRWQPRRRRCACGSRSTRRAT